MNPKDKAFTPEQLELFKRFDNDKLRRLNRIRVRNSNNKKIGLALGFTVAAFYAYSMVAVQQEHFLDDFDKPEIVQD